MLLRVLWCVGLCRFLLEAGAIPALLHLSNVGNKGARNRCAMALCNLLCTPEAESQIIGLNAVGAFDALALCRDDEIRERCVVSAFHLLMSHPPPPFGRFPSYTPLLVYVCIYVCVVFSGVCVWGGGVVCVCPARRLVPADRFLTRVLVWCA